METKKSVVTAIAENVKQWAGQNGTVYYHTITFANGDSGSYGAKSPKCEKFVVGQESEYTIELKQNGNYTNITIKPVQSQGGFNPKQPKNEKLIVAQSCLNYATQLHMGKQSPTEHVIEVAEVFYKWVLEKGGLS